MGIANLCAVLVGKTMVHFVTETSAPWVFPVVFVGCIIMGLVVGALCGLLNGFLVSKFGIPPMLVTMGSMQLFQGICMVLTEGRRLQEFLRSIRQSWDRGSMDFFPFR